MLTDKIALAGLDQTGMSTFMWHIVQRDWDLFRLYIKFLEDQMSTLGVEGYQL